MNPLSKTLVAAAVCGASVFLSTIAAPAAPTIHWKLDETTGTVAADSSGNGIDGAWAGTVGSPGWASGAGIDGGSLVLSGADGDSFATGSFDEVNDPLTVITGTPMTISAWVKSTSTAKDGVVYLGDGSTGNSYYLLQLQGGNGRNVARNPAEIAATGSSVNDGGWHHVLCVYAGTAERSIYIDGLLAATNETDVSEVVLNRFGVGALTRATPLAPVDLFEGELDDVALWDRAFTDLDAAALNGLGVLRAGNAADLDPMVEAFAAQSTAVISGRDWEYATGLAGSLGATGGSVAGLNAFVVLDDSSNGMKMSAPVGLPVIGSYTTSVETIFLGENATLSWDVSGADTIEIDQGVGAVANPSGSEVVSPTETTTYTLTATSAAGSVMPQVTINVIPNPIIDVFGATPGVVFAGEDVTLAWEVQNTTALEIDNGVGTVTGAIGSVVVSPNETTTYTLTATNANPGEMTTAMVTVTVFSSPPPRELLLHWPLDETDGTTSADLAGDNPGVFLEDGGAITRIAGQIGGALTFPNENNVAVRAITTTPLVENYPFSIGGWVKTTDSANDTFAVLGTNQTGQYHSLLVRSGNAQAIARTGAFFTVTGTPVNDDAWHHIVAVFSHPASCSLYVDGLFVGDRVTEAGAFVTPDRFAIGALARTDTSVVDAFNGSVDDVSFWRGILSANEVAALAGGATGLGLNASDIDALLTGFDSQSVATAAGSDWSYREGLTGEVGTTGGAILGGDAFIVLDESGNGMVSEALQFSIISVVREGAGRRITWESVPGSTYGIQFTTDLNDWSDEVDDGTDATGEVSSFLDLSPLRLAEPRGYYRVVLLPPAV